MRKFSLLIRALKINIYDAYTHFFIIYLCRKSTQLHTSHTSNKYIPVAYLSGRRYYY